MDTPDERAATVFLRGKGFFCALLFPGPVVLPKRGFASGKAFVRFEVSARYAAKVIITGPRNCVASASNWNGRTRGGGGGNCHASPISVNNKLTFDEFTERVAVCVIRILRMPISFLTTTN